MVLSNLKDQKQNDIHLFIVKNSDQVMYLVLKCGFSSFEKVILYLC